MEPCSVQDLPQDEVASPELPTLHEPLMIAPEHLVVACILDCCSPPSFVDEVDVVTPQLLLHGFVESLAPWLAQVDFRGKACFGPVDQEEWGLPDGSSGCGPVAP